jgi:hypothetical protein
MTKKTSIAVISLLGILVLLTACSHPDRSGAVASPVKISYCNGGQQARPTVIAVICLSNDITARHLRWSAWGKPFTTAIGRALVDMCAFEDCHTGAYKSFPIVLIASKLVTCPNGARAYSRLQYTFVGRSPFQGIPSNISFKNYIAGAGRPHPPSHQTVSLTC